MSKVAFIVLCFIPFISGHGYISSPVSRSYGCKLKINSNCGQVEYEPQSIEAKKGFPDEGPIDEQLAGAGKFNPLDDYDIGRWKFINYDVYENRSDFYILQIIWTMTAVHRSTKYVLYLPHNYAIEDQPFSRNEIDYSNVCEYNLGGSLPPAKLVIHCYVKKTVINNIINGNVRLYGVWDVADTGNAFYQIIDAIIKVNHDQSKLQNPNAIVVAKPINAPSPSLPPTLKPTVRPTTPRPGSGGTTPGDATGALTENDLGQLITTNHDKLLTNCGKIVDVSQCLKNRGFVGYPCDCNQYLQCASNAVFLMKCPGSLVFSLQTYRCEYPQDTDTSYCDNTTPPLTEGDLGSVIPNPSEQNKLLTKCGKIVDLSKCLVHGGFAGYPCNCNQFLHCSYNVVNLMSCPGGLVFNLKNYQCDWPQLTDTSYCEDTSVTKPPPPPSPPLLTESDWENVITNNQDKILTNCGEVVNLSKCLQGQSYEIYPCDCNKYIQCSSVQAFLRPCPGGLAFNIKKIWCDYPANVDLTKCRLNKNIFTTYSDTNPGVGTIPSVTDFDDIDQDNRQVSLRDDKSRFNKLLVMLYLNIINLWN